MIKDDRKLQSLPYRPCVGIVLFNAQGHVFVGHRIDTPNAWQMPQGGIDPGEDIEQAAQRELLEETGTNKANVIHIMDRTLHYDLPDDLQKKMWNGQYRGQEQYWVGMQFTGQDSDIVLDAHPLPEFNKWQWVPLPQVIDMIVPFKREVYRKVINAFTNIKP